MRDFDDNKSSIIYYSPWFIRASTNIIHTFLFKIEKFIFPVGVDTIFLYNLFINILLYLYINCIYLII